MMKSNINSGARLLGKFAPRDLTSSLAYAIGFRDWSYRRKAVDALQLTKGDRVVEIGCGTGRNFALLERAVGPGGAIIAVDISEAILARARNRAARHGWSNIEFVRSDAATYQFPAALDGVHSSYTLVVVPEYDRVIERACEALKEGKRCVVLDQSCRPVRLRGWSRYWIFYRGRSSTRESLGNAACGSPSGATQATFEWRSCISDSSTWRWVKSRGWRATATRCRVETSHAA